VTRKQAGNPATPETPETPATPAAPPATPAAPETPAAPVTPAASAAPPAKPNARKARKASGAPASPRELALIAMGAAADKKGEDIVALDVGPLLVVTEYFVIATGRTNIQVRAIADEVEEQLRVKGGEKPIGREGIGEDKWILLDYGDVVVHVFQPAERDFYRLERLWADAPRLELPDAETPAAANQ
jgi:ribosome-associated protein